MNEQQFVAIIPAYNEEETVADVVATLLGSQSVKEVIVVSDGSTDSTAARAREAGATVHELSVNGGKAEAMMSAVKQTTSPVVGFFDADLFGLTPEHVHKLAAPVLSGDRAMNVALRDRGVLLTALTRHLPLIAGERILHRSVIEGVPTQYLEGFMAEAALNYYCRARRLSYGVVELKGLSIRRKYEKVGYAQAVIQYIKMFYQVAKAMIIVRIAHLRGTF